jgi:hypothetical protein
MTRDLEAAAVTRQHIRRMQRFRATFAVLVVLGALVLAGDIAAGSYAALFAAASVIFCVLMIVRNTRLIRTMRLRERELSRPAGQIEARLRELEEAHPCPHAAAEPVDLFNPSTGKRDGERVAWVCPDCNAELPAGWKPAAKAEALPAPVWCRCPDGTRAPVQVHVPESATPVASYCAACGRRVRRGGTGQTSTVHYSGTADGMVAAGGGGGLGGVTVHFTETVPGGTGFLSAKARWDDVAYPSEASQHFAALARVGRKYCASYCPVCAERLDALMRASVLAPKTDLGDGRADLARDMRDLRELDGMRAGLRPFVTSDIAPAGANDFHVDSAGREWCRDGEGLCWLKFAPDGPWHRQDKPEGGKQ